MSVLKCNRSESKVQFITTAIEIEGKTIHLLTRMSPKYQRLFADKVMGLAIDLVNSCEEAFFFVIDCNISVFSGRSEEHTSELQSL